MSVVSRTRDRGVDADACTGYDGALAGESPHPATSYLVQVARAVALAAVYVCAAKLGLLMDAVSGFATLIWPATGIALVALLLWGPALWPGIFIGAFITNLWTGAPALVALGIATGNTAEALVGAWAVTRATGLREAPRRLSDVVALVGLAAIVSTVVSASVGALSLYIGRVVTAAHVVETWRAWWLGDATGNLVIAPLLLAWLATADDDEQASRAGAWSSWSRSWSRSSVPRCSSSARAWRRTTRSRSRTCSFRSSSGRRSASIFASPRPPRSSSRCWRRGAPRAAAGRSSMRGWRRASSSCKCSWRVVSVTMLLLSAAISERNRAVAAREWVLAAVSHDLKNPLQMIGLSVEHALRVLDADKESARRPVANIRAGADRMTSLVRDLLDYASMEAGRFSIDPQTAVGALPGRSGRRPHARARRVQVADDPRDHRVE